MPRKGYETITVKSDTFKKFIKAKRQSKLQNSPFLETLLAGNKKKKVKFGRKLLKKDEVV